MRSPLRARILVLAGCAALVPALPAPAQISVQFHYGEDEYHRIDARHQLHGQQYQTMAALAHVLDETAQHLNHRIYRASGRDRSHAHLLASVSDFSRRTADFHNRMDAYLESPWDVRREVDDLSRRARYVNRDIQNAQLFPETYDMWNAEVDVLGRMQRVLRGEQVEVPASPVHDEDRGRWWDHRDNDRDRYPEPPR